MDVVTVTSPGSIFTIAIFKRDEARVTLTVERRGLQPLPPPPPTPTSQEPHRKFFLPAVAECSLIEVNLIGGVSLCYCRSLPYSIKHLDATVVVN